MISEIIKVTSHRPWTLPEGQWQYYQEWNKALFLHWEIPVEILQPLIPEGLEIDILNGKTWVSLVAFTMENIRPKSLPPLSIISNFHEINLRAYVLKDSKPGVYFLNIEAQKIISVFIAKSLSALPYEKAKITKAEINDLVTYTSYNKLKNFNLEVEYKVIEDTYAKSDLDKWLTERYCLYVTRKNNLFRYEIHHEEWILKTVKLEKLKVNYQIDTLVIKDLQPDLIHFSEGVKVLAWQRHTV